MANLQSTTIDGGITEKEGTDSIAVSQIIATTPIAGTNVSYDSSNTTIYCTSVYDINADKIVVAYRDDTDGGVGKAVVGTIADEPSTTITWGTPVTFSGRTTEGAWAGNVATLGFAMSYDVNAQKVLICWGEGVEYVSGGKGASKVGTVSGTGATGTISFGSEEEWEDDKPPAHRTFAEHIVYDSNAQKHVLIWVKTGTGAVASVGTITGTSVSWGTPVLVMNTFKYPGIAFDSTTNQIVIACDKGTGNYGVICRVGTITGTSITFGTETTGAEQSSGQQLGDSDYGALTYDANAQKMIYVYSAYWEPGAGVVNGIARLGTVTGSGSTGTITWSSTFNYSGYGNRTRGNKITYNPDIQKCFISWAVTTRYDGFAVGVLQGCTATVSTVTLTCTTTSGSTTVTTTDTSTLVPHSPIGNPNRYDKDYKFIYAGGSGNQQRGLTHNVPEGMSVSGNNIENVGSETIQTIGTGTRIASITSSTTFELSVVANASGSTSLTFTNLTFSPAVSIEASGITSSGQWDNKIAYDSSRKVMVLPRQHPNPSATVISFDGSSITIDLATGNFFEMDLQTVSKDIRKIIVSNPHASQVSTFILQITQTYPAIDIKWSEITNFKWVAGIGPTLTTTNNKVDTFSFTTWDNGTSWYGKVVGQNFPRNYNLNRIFGERGVWAGGSHDSGNVTTIDYITIATPGNATAFGDLTAGHNRNIAGTSNGSRGVFPGQFGNVTTIDYITIATTGDAIDFGDLTQGRSQISATSDGVRGVFAGGTTGDNPTQIVNTIDYVTIATTGDAIDFGDLTSTGVQGAGSASDGSRGLFAGGSVYQGAAVGIYIDYITIATLGNATDFGDLLETRRHLGGASDGSRAVFGGGFATTATHKNLEYVSISSPGNAALFGELTHSTLTQVASTSNGPRGVWGGGYVTNIMAYITIATTGNAIDFGDLTVARSGSGATSGD